MIHGTYHFGRKRVACRNAYCTTCRDARFVEGFRSWVVVHVGFIPILPIATTVRWFCPTCQNQIDARRPSRPLILVAGAFFGLLMSFVGIMILLDGQEKEAGIGCLVGGPLMAGGLIYLIRKQDYESYSEAKRAVEPLSGDHCPYCKNPVFMANTPHCHSCRVDIITK